MLRRRILIALILLSALPLARAWGADEKNVPWYQNPSVDGSIGGSEYPPPAITLPTAAGSCQIYMCQNSSALFIAAAIPDSTYSVDDNVLVCVGSEPPSPDRTPRMDDYQIMVSRGGNYSASGLRRYRIRTTSDSNGWRFEAAIGFSDLSLATGENRSMAFAIFIRDGGLEVARWPGNADKDSPKTWGALSSSYYWGTIDLKALSLITYPQRAVTGQNVTIALTYANQGRSPCLMVQIGLYLDNALLQMLNDTRIEPSTSHVVSIIWKATSGTHTFRARLDPLNNIFETDKSNNELSCNISVQLAKLTISAQEGVNITVNGNTTSVGPSDEAVFNLNLGAVSIAAQKVMYLGDARYVFQRWRWEGGGSNNSNTTLSISGDEQIEAVYATEYLVRMSFLNSRGQPISAPDSVRFSAPNGSSIMLSGRYDIWLPQGTLMISNIVWSAVDVKPSNTTYTIRGPRTLSIRCRVYDVIVLVKDSIDLPVLGANVTLILPNGTVASRMTGDGGFANFYRVPAGMLSGTVANLGIITTIADQELTSDLTLQYTMALSFGTITFMIIMAAAILVVLAFYWRRKARKQEGEKLLRSLGPPE